jgi:ankyrin repeat protein
LLNKINGKTITRHGIRFRYFENVGGPVEDVEVARKECCISLVLNGFAARTENETLEYMSNIVKILNEDNKLDKILLPGYYTALILAVKNNQMKVAGILLKANANVDAQDFFGKTALMHACFAYPTAENNYASETHPNLVMVEILLKNNSTLNIQDNAGITALIYATVNGKYYLEIVNVLLRAGAKIDVQDMHGETALMWASASGYFEKVKILLKANAGVNIQDNKGSTALMKATERGHIKTMKLLLTEKTEVDVQGENGTTALVLAAAMGNLEAVELLLKSNANVQLVASGYTAGLVEGLTAAGVAKLNGHDKVAQAIEEFNN